MLITYFIIYNYIFQVLNGEEKFLLYALYAIKKTKTFCYFSKFLTNSF